MHCSNRQHRFVVLLAAIRVLDLICCQQRKSRLYVRAYLSRAVYVGQLLYFRFSLLSFGYHSCMCSAQIQLTELTKPRTRQEPLTRRSNGPKLPAVSLKVVVPTAVRAAAMHIELLDTSSF